MQAGRRLEKREVRRPSKSGNNGFTASMAVFVDD
jgi:hypothetical protein